MNRHRLTRLERTGKVLCEELAFRKGVSLEEFVQTVTTRQLFWYGVRDGLLFGPLRRWLAKWR